MVACPLLDPLRFSQIAKQIALLLDVSRQTATPIFLESFVDYQTMYDKCDC
jgi:hypothetical protein